MNCRRIIKPFVLTLACIGLGACATHKAEKAVAEANVVTEPEPSADAVVVSETSPAQRLYGGPDVLENFTGPSVVAGQAPGIEVGQYPPDFQLQPVELYPELQEWLGDKAPKGIEDTVMFSDLIGKKPVLLLMGSYT